MGLSSIYEIRDPCQILERRHCLAEIVERGAGVLVERLRVDQPHPEREFFTVTENASRHGCRFAQQRLGLFEALQIQKGIRTAGGCYEGSAIFFTIDPQTSRVYVSLQK